MDTPSDVALVIFLFNPFTAEIKKKKQQQKNPRKSVRILFQNEGRIQKEEKKERNLPHHSHAVNWFSTVNLCSVFGQVISKTGEHEMSAFILIRAEDVEA